jgi:hypothetical protein
MIVNNRKFAYLNFYDNYKISAQVITKNSKIQKNEK